MGILWETCYKEFIPDGALRDIQVIDATAADWQSLLEYLAKTNSHLRYQVDGLQSQLPEKASLIFDEPRNATHTLLISLGDFEIATHFFEEDMLEFDFLPADIRSQRQLDQLQGFIEGLGKQLQKWILVYYEGWEMSPFFIYDPRNHSIQYRPIEASS